MAAECAFDRITGGPVTADRLKTYAEGLAQYHLHPESRFLHGNYTDPGITERLHIVVDGAELIGKEATQLEEQVYLGENPEAQMVYGPSQDDRERQWREVLVAC